ncbi:hypothetical protein Hanom_Chr15g01365271 [Helianthus anomalus]
MFYRFCIKYKTLLDDYWLIMKVFVITNSMFLHHLLQRMPVPRNPPERKTDTK